MNFHKKPIYNIAKTLCNGKNKTNFLCAGGGINMIKNKNINTINKEKESQLIQQQTTDELLEKSELRYRRLFETAQDAILILDGKTGQIIDANPYVQNLIGYSLKELTGKTLWEISPFKNIAENKALFEKLRKETFVRYEHLPLETKQKKLRYVEFISNSYMVGDKKIIQCNIRDITDRKKAEEKVSEMQKKLQHLLDTRTTQLYITTKSLTNETKERQKAENEILNTKEYLENVIDSAWEVIFSLDSNHRMNTWNKTAEQLTGYTEKEVFNRSIKSLPVFNDHKQIVEIIKNNGTNIGYDDIVLLTKNNKKRVVRISESTVKNVDGGSIGSLFIGRDITANLEAHGKILPGNSYILVDKSSDPLRNLYDDLTTSGYDGIYISRSSVEMKSNTSHGLNSQLFLLSHEKIKGFDTIANPDELLDMVNEVAARNKKTIIILDGSHYFITKFTYKKYIDTLYKINDVVINSQLIVLIHINPNIVDKTQMAILEHEFQLLPSQKLNNIMLDDFLYSMLRFIYEQNQNNSIVSYKKITGKYNVAYSTAAKRLQHLEEKGLIFIKKQGKFQTVYTTEKAKTLLHKRQTV
jgi:PAS domain S-box-containing protein